MAADKGSPLNDRRAEEAFSTLATGKARADRDAWPGDGAGPWKAATSLFLLLALALPLAAGIRESRRDQREEDCVAAAMARLPAVSLAARDRDYPGALASLGRVVAALASVPGLLSTVAQAEDLLRRDLARRGERSGKARDAMVRDEKRFVAWKEAVRGTPGRRPGAGHRSTLRPR